MLLDVCSNIFSFYCFSSVPFQNVKQIDDFVQTSFVVLQVLYHVSALVCKNKNFQFKPLAFLKCLLFSAKMLFLFLNFPTNNEALYSILYPVPSHLKHCRMEKFSRKHRECALNKFRYQQYRLYPKKLEMNNLAN